MEYREGKPPAAVELSRGELWPSSHVVTMMAAGRRELPLLTHEDNRGFLQMHREKESGCLGGCLTSSHLTAAEAISAATSTAMTTQARTKARRAHRLLPSPPYIRLRSSASSTATSSASTYASEA